MTQKNSRISHVEKEYGVGIMALEKKPDKLYDDKVEAVKAAISCGVQFIVEYVGNSKKILAWGAQMQRRDDLIKRYKGFGDKIAQLNSCEEPIWLELSTESGYNHIIPFSQVGPFEPIDLKEIL